VDDHIQHYGLRELSRHLRPQGDIDIELGWLANDFDDELDVLNHAGAKTKSRTFREKLPWEAATE
jgi:hypothetical protein